MTTETAAPEQAGGSVFANTAFTVILVASAASSIGAAMFDTASSWLMTSLNPDPRMVSAVQMAVTLPMFLLTIPAGALADIIDPRKLLIVVQIFVALVALAFAAAIWTGAHTPLLLLAATFFLGVGGALAAPAWQLIAPLLAPKPQLDRAIAINAATYNVSRAIGPALGGVSISAFGVDFPFWINGLSVIGIVLALLWWRPPPRVKETLPAERFVNAVRSGIRFVRFNRDMDSTLIRTVAYFPFACSFWALLPLIARRQMHTGPEVYGALMGAIGVGSIAASFALGALKQRFNPNQIGAIASLATAAAILLFTAVQEPALAFAASVIGGAGWILMMTTLFMSVQVALPDWVRGRGLAIFLTVYFGGMTVGSALWGEVAAVAGLSTSLMISSLCVVLGLALTSRWKLETAAGLDLTPSLHWGKPTIPPEFSDDQGPILVSIAYQIDPKDRPAFLEVMEEIRELRMRAGAYAWKIFEDPIIAGRFVETSLVQSLLELKYSLARMTNADRDIEGRAQPFSVEPPQPTYLVAAERDRPARHLFHLFEGRHGAQRHNGVEPAP
jgi:MFS family permease